MTSEKVCAIVTKTSCLERTLRSVFPSTPPCYGGLSTSPQVDALRTRSGAPRSALKACGLQHSRSPHTHALRLLCDLSPSHLRYVLPSSIPCLNRSIVGRTISAIAASPREMLTACGVTTSPRYPRHFYFDSAGAHNLYRLFLDKHDHPDSAHTVRVRLINLRELHFLFQRGSVRIP